MPQIITSKKAEIIYVSTKKIQCHLMIRTRLLELLLKQTKI